MLKHWPRRAADLPAGQRVLDEMLRFADDPRRQPPPIPEDPTSIVDQLLDLDVTARFAAVRGGDGVQARFVIDDLLADDVLAATHMNGGPLTLRHGAPLRLITPGQYGYKNVKHLTAIDFCAEEPPSEIGAKEHLRARVELEERHSRLPNWLVRWPYRLAVPPTAWMADRALR